MNPRSRVILRIFIPVVLFLLVTGLSAVAKEGDPMGEGGERHLNGHGFLPSIYVDDPFVSTVFQNHTGVGMANNPDATFHDLDGNELFSVEGNLLVAALGLGFQQKLGSKLAVGVAASGLVRSGTDAQSFMVEGADVDRQASLWAKYLVMRNEKSQWSLGLDFNYSNTLYFTPGDFARYIYGGGEIEDAPLLVSSKVWTSRLTANWARAFSPAFGLRINGEIGMYQVPESSGIYTGSHRVGILGEYDLKPTGVGWPLGFTLGYTQNLPDDDPFTGLGGVLLGFWYTSKQDFVVGVETGSMKMNVTNQETEKVDAFFGIFTLKYYF